MNLKGWYSRESDNWATPSILYDKMMKLNFFDPCPLMPTKDGLKIEWAQKTL